MANLAALVSGAFGGSARPSDFIPEITDQPDDGDEDDARRLAEERAKREAAMRAASQRALHAALSAAFPKKPNG